MKTAAFLPFGTKYFNTHLAVMAVTKSCRSLTNLVQWFLRKLWDLKNFFIREGKVWPADLTLIRWGTGVRCSALFRTNTYYCIKFLFESASYTLPRSSAKALTNHPSDVAHTNQSSKCMQNFRL